MKKIQKNLIFIAISVLLICYISVQTYNLFWFFVGRDLVSSYGEQHCSVGKHPVIATLKELSIVDSQQFPSKLYIKIENWGNTSARYLTIAKDIDTTICKAEKSNVKVSIVTRNDALVEKIVATFNVRLETSVKSNSNDVYNFDNVISKMIDELVLVPSLDNDESIKIRTLIVPLHSSYMPMPWLIERNNGLNAESNFELISYDHGLTWEYTPLSLQEGTYGEFVEKYKVDIPLRIYKKSNSK